jgi:hypothetical protein
MGFKTFFFRFYNLFGSDKWTTVAVPAYDRCKYNFANPPRPEKEPRLC